MPGCSNLNDDDNAAKLMPNVAKLIAESDSLESKGSSSMKLCGICVEDNIDVENSKPSRQRRESVFRDVANKYLRRRATCKRSVCGSRSSALLSPGPHHRVGSSFTERRGACSSEKENVRPKARRLVGQGTRSILEQKLALRDTSQKAVREFKTQPSHTVFKLGQRRPVDPKLQGAVNCNSVSESKPLAEHASTVALAAASHSSQGAEGACYLPNLAAKSQRGKAKPYSKTMALNLRVLREGFAELDEEALEEEEVPIAHLTRIKPVMVSETLLKQAAVTPEEGVRNRKDFSGSERGDVVSASLNSKIEEATLSSHSHGQGHGGVGFCTSQCVLSKTPRRDHDVQASESTVKGNVAASTSGHNYPGVTLPNALFSIQMPERSSQYCSKAAAQQQFKAKLHRMATSLELRELQDKCGQINLEVVEPKEGWTVHSTTTKPQLLSGVVLRQADGNQGDNVKCRNEENPPRSQQDSGCPSLKEMDDEARIADINTSPSKREASVQELTGKGTNVCAELEVEQAEGSCNDKRGYSSTEPNVDNFMELTADGADANAAHREGSVPGVSTYRDLQSTLSRVKRLLEQPDVTDIPLQGGTYSTRDTSATSPRNPLLSTGFHYSRKGRSSDMNQRRLVFDSSSESLSRQKVVDSNSSDDSLSSVEFKGRTNSADKLNRDVYEFGTNITFTPHQEAKTQLTDEVIDQVNDRNCISHSSEPKNATHCEGLAGRETLLTDSLAQDDNQPVFEASGVVGKDTGTDPPCPQSGSANDCRKFRSLGKRTLANLGAPIDGGREWKQGRRVSTRIKSRPLDWWRGEKMLYGRVHSTLCTLIGIKTTTPDPVWPRPRPKRGEYSTRNFHVDSFVDDSHHDLLRLAAQ